jgi:site-specific DNA-methyltransferase (adenine-specific)
VGYGAIAKLMENSRFLIFNRSSESMSELADGSIDLVVTSPPYNVGTRYLTDPDDRPFTEYYAMLDRVFGEVARILKPEGVVVVELADTVFFDGFLFSLAAAIAEMFHKRKFQLVERHINLVKSYEGFEQPERNWSQEFVARGNAHSNVHHILVLSRVGQFKKYQGQILYENYLGAEEGHPCRATAPNPI